mmetsp:Transcript_58799/g.102907  ORF Transcript_58799/g.102907 Transcript_58799/m.102907 type:complete len:186 (+) Transcript_58799:180-737(+)
MGQQAHKCPCHHGIDSGIHAYSFTCGLVTGRQADNELVTQFDSALKEMRFEDVHFLFQTPTGIVLDREYSIRGGGRAERTVRRRLFDEASAYARAEDASSACEFIPTASFASPTSSEKHTYGPVATRNPLAVAAAMPVAAPTSVAEAAECDPLRPPLAWRLGLDSPECDSSESDLSPGELVRVSA